MPNISTEDLLRKIAEIGIIKKKHEVSSNIEAAIYGFEEKRKAKLPSDFKEFLTRYGDMSLKDDYYYRPLEKNPWTPDDGFETVDLFYGFSKDNYDLSTVNSSLFGQVSEAFITIAEVSGGNKLCIRVIGENYGKVYFWDHDIKGPNGKEYYLAANSFAELIMAFTTHIRKPRVDLSEVKITLSDDLL